MNTITRAEFEAAIHLYVGGDLDGEDARLVESWLEEHPEDGELVQRARAAREVLVGHRSAWDAVELDLWDGVAPRLGRLQAAPAPVPAGPRPASARASRSWHRHTAAAAAVALLSTGTFLFGRGSVPAAPAEVSPGQPAMATAVPVAERLVVSPAVAEVPAATRIPTASRNGSNTLAGGSTSAVDPDRLDRLRAAMNMARVGMPMPGDGALAPAALDPGITGRRGASPLRKTGGFGEHLVRGARVVPVDVLDSQPLDRPRPDAGTSLTGGH